MSKEELNKKIEVVEKELRSYTWRELETNGKFAKNDKLSFITDDMLIVGCDIGNQMFISLKEPSLIFTMPTEKVSSITVKSRRTWMLEDSRRESLRATNWCWS